MKVPRKLQIAVAIAVCTAAASQSALAGAEPKKIPVAAISTAHFKMTGEPKNEPPFTNPATSNRQGTVAIVTTAGDRFKMVGEPKDEPPFTDPVSQR